MGRPARSLRRRSVLGYSYLFAFVGKSFLSRLRESFLFHLFAFLEFLLPSFRFLFLGLSDLGSFIGFSLFGSSFLSGLSLGFKFLSIRSVLGLSLRLKFLSQSPFLRSSLGFGLRHDSLLRCLFLSFKRVCGSLFFGPFFRFAFLAGGLLFCLLQQ